MIISHDIIKNKYILMTNNKNQEIKSGVVGKVRIFVRFGYKWHIELSI